MPLSTISGAPNAACSAPSSAARGSALMKSIYWLVLVAPVCGTLVATAEDSSWQRPNWGLYSHESIRIDRPAATIWPFILNTDQWKHALQHRRVSGIEGKTGEIVAESLVAGQEPLFYGETVELVPNVRRTIKLYAPNHGPLIGFASWELEEIGARTHVTYHVYSETLMSPDELKSRSAAELAAAGEASESQNQRRFRTELNELKRLVEQTALAAPSKRSPPTSRHPGP
jgi:hypothetical protein